MQDTHMDESQKRDFVADRTPNAQPNMTRWADRYLRPYLPLWIIIALVVIAFLVVIFWFSL